MTRSWKWWGLSLRMLYMVARSRHQPVAKKLDVHPKETHERPPSPIPKAKARKRLSQQVNADCEQQHPLLRHLLATKPRLLSRHG